MIRQFTKPTASIIIPCYNGEATVGETIESLQKQTFRNWEAIIVNDGSIDNSVEIIRRYQAKDSRIKHIYQENQGLPGARNKGLTVAQGEFVNFLDADDLLLPNMLHRMVQQLSEKSSLGIISCGWIYSDAKLHDFSWVNTQSKKGRLFKDLAHQNLFPCHSILLRRSILDNVGLFDCSLKHCHDWDMWLRVARAGIRFGCLPEPLVVYRMMPVTLSRNPITFFESGKEVIRRGHEPDPRVKNPDGKFSKGCTCEMKEAKLGLLLNCVSLAIAKGNAAEASELLEKILAEEDLHITPGNMRVMRNQLWFGSAIPKGNWDALWSRVSRPLLQFLLRQEERLKIHGFAMKCLLELIDWNNILQETDLEKLSGRKLLLALRKKITKRFFRLRASS